MEAGLFFKASEVCFSLAWRIGPQTYFSYEGVAELQCIIKYGLFEKSLQMFEIKTSYQYLEQLAGQDSQRVPDSHFITETGSTPATSWCFFLEFSTLGEVDRIRDHVFLEENI